MRRHLTILGFVVVLSWVALPSSAFAQNRQGFWFGFGGGYGSAGVSCDDCEEGRESSGAGYLRGGWTLNPQTLIGLDFNLWAKSANIEPGTEATINLYNVMGTITYYPPATNFFVKGGAGVSILDTDINVRGSKLSADLGQGFGFIVGAGYDFPLGSRIALTPAVDFWYGSLGDIKIAGDTFTTNWKQNVIDVTIGLTFP